MESATLHNEAEVVRLGVRAGDLVVVERSGDVIPKVLRKAADLHDDGAVIPALAPLEDSEGGGIEGSGGGVEYRLPAECPVCGGAVEREPGGVLARCVGRYTCAAQVVEKIRCTALHCTK